MSRTQTHDFRFMVIMVIIVLCCLVTTMEVIIKLLFMLFFIVTGIKYVTKEYGGVLYNTKITYD